MAGPLPFFGASLRRFLHKDTPLFIFIKRTLLTIDVLLFPSKGMFHRLNIFKIFNIQHTKIQFVTLTQGISNPSTEANTGYIEVTSMYPGPTGLSLGEDTHKKVFF